MDYAPLGNSKLDFERLVQQGKAQRVLPNTDTGYKSYGTGRLFLPAGTNYEPNPGLVNHTDGVPTGWTFVKSDGITPVTGTPVYTRALLSDGTYSTRIQYEFQGGDGETTLIFGSLTGVGTFATNDTYTFQSRVSFTRTGCAMALWISECDASGTYLNGGGTTVPDNTIDTIYARTYTALVPLTSRLQPIFYFTGCHAGDIMDLTFSHVMIEKNSVLTPYFDGSHDNCVWTGTANASTSTRTLSTLTYTLPFSSTSRGTVAIQHNPIYASTYTGTPGLWYLVMSGFGIWAYWGGLGYWSGQISDGNDWSHGFVPSGSCTEFGVGQNSPSVYRWDEARCGSAQLGTTVSTLNSHDMNLVTTSREFKFSPVYTTRFATGSTRNTIVSPSAKSDSWVTAILANSGAAFNDPMRLWRDFMEPGDVLFPLTEDSVGYQKIVNIGSGTPTGLDATFTTTAATTDTGYEVYDG